MARKGFLYKYVSFPIPLSPTPLGVSYNYNYNLQFYIFPGQRPTVHLQTVDDLQSARLLYWSEQGERNL